MKVAREELKEWANIFDAIGNPTRLGILLILYGSDILGKGKSLTFSDIKEIMEIPSDSVVDHHLTRLITTGLVTKEPTSDNPSGRVYPLYHVTRKFVDFLEQSGLAEPISRFIKEQLK